MSTCNNSNLSKLLSEPELMSKKELSAANKIKLPKFMMTLAEFESNSKGRNKEKELNCIWFKIFNPSLIETEYEDDETKSTSIRDSHPEVLLLDYEWKNLLNNGMKLESDDWINSTPYFSRTKSIFDIRKWETQETMDDSPFSLWNDEKSEDTDCQSQHSHLTNFTEGIRLTLDSEENMKPISKSNTWIKMNDYKLKILSTINWKLRNENDEEIWESTPQKHRECQIPNSAEVKNKYKIKDYQFECAFTEIDEDKEENSRNSLRLSVPMKLKRSFMLSPASEKKHVIREALSMNYTYEDIKDLNRKIEAKLLQVSRLSKLVLEQEQINDSLNEEILKIATIKLTW